MKWSALRQIVLKSASRQIGLSLHSQIHRYSSNLILHLPGIVKRNRSYFQHIPLHALSLNLFASQTTQPWDGRLFAGCELASQICWLASCGISHKGIISDCPELTEEDIRACLAYRDDRREGSRSDS